MALNFLNPGQEGLTDKFRQILESQGDLDITSGFRNKAYNEKVGGAKNSQHTHGTAADISMSGWDDARRSKFVRDTMKQGGRGFITYTDSPDMLHVDTGRDKPHFMHDRSSKNMANAPQWMRDLAAEYAGGAVEGPTQSDTKAPLTRREKLSGFATSMGELAESLNGQLSDYPARAQSRDTMQLALSATPQDATNIQRNMQTMQQAGLLPQDALPTNDTAPSSFAPGAGYQTANATGIDPNNLPPEVAEALGIPSSVVPQARPTPQGGTPVMSASGLTDEMILTDPEVRANAGTPLNPTEETRPKLSKAARRTQFAESLEGFSLGLGQMSAGQAVDLAPAWKRQEARRLGRTAQDMQQQEIDIAKQRESRLQAVANQTVAPTVYDKAAIGEAAASLGYTSEQITNGLTDGNIAGFASQILGEGAPSGSGDVPYTPEQAEDVANAYAANNPEASAEYLNLIATNPDMAEQVANSMATRTPDKDATPERSPAFVAEAIDHINEEADISAAEGTPEGKAIARRLRSLARGVKRDNDSADTALTSMDEILEAATESATAATAASTAAEVDATAAVADRDALTIAAERAIEARKAAAEVLADVNATAAERDNAYKVIAAKTIAEVNELAASTAAEVNIDAAALGTEEARLVALEAEKTKIREEDRLSGRERDEKDLDKAARQNLADQLYPDNAVAAAIYVEDGGEAAQTYMSNRAAANFYSGQGHTSIANLAAQGNTNLAAELYTGELATKAEAAETARQEEQTEALATSVQDEFPDLAMQMRSGQVEEATRTYNELKNAGADKLPTDAQMAIWATEEATPDQLLHLREQSLAEAGVSDSWDEAQKSYFESLMVDLRKEDERADVILSQVALADQIMQNPDFVTGAATPWYLPITGVGRQLGLDVNYNQSEQEVFDSTTSAMFQHYRLEGSGQTSDFEAGKMMDSIQNLGKTPEANRAMIQYTEHVFSRAKSDNRAEREYYSRGGELGGTLPKSDISLADYQRSRALEEGIGLTPFVSLPPTTDPDAALEAMTVLMDNPNNPLEDGDMFFNDEGKLEQFDADLHARLVEARK